jgi:hypothetical protein
MATHRNKSCMFTLAAILAVASIALADDVAEKSHWAFQKITRPAIPAVRNSTWIQTGVDAFVLRKLENENIAPSPQADRQTLIRRLSLDLIGLPPTPAETAAFLADQQEGAVPRLVDRLLGSPRFGEKWARWWLDLARYADSDGYLTDQLRPTAWRYRQWVVDALNADAGFDQFTIEQIAGDLLPDATVDQKIATAFQRNTLSNREGGADPKEFRVKQVIDRTGSLGTVWMGLTVECAQCHDHKYDPISQKEFYRLYAFFDNADEINTTAPLDDEWERHQAARPAYDQQRKELLAPIAEPLAALQAEWERKLLHADAHPGEDYRWDRAWEVLGLIWGGGQGEGQLEGQVIVKTPLTDRPAEDQERLRDYFLTRGELVDGEKWKELKLAEVKTKLDELAQTLPPLSRAPAMRRARQIRAAYVHLRGDFRSRGEPVTPGTPTVLGPGLGQAGPARLTLARWLVTPDHPLTARVAVNRLWQQLFGRGLVATAEDFGSQGSPPSHPELLDWLAAEFMRQHWSIKAILKTMATSATYQQSSAVRPELKARDSENVLLARHSRVRLSGELIRDSALAVGGLLDDRIGGPSVRPPQPDSVSMEGFENKWIPSEGADRYRRGLYTFLQRTSPFAQFVTFDLPDVNQPCARRERSNTPLQALNLLNDPVFFEAAQGLACRLLTEGPAETGRRISFGFQLGLGRVPTAVESERLATYFNQQVEIYRGEPAAAKEAAGGGIAGVEDPVAAAWVALASVWLNLDEFITKE